jgi:hypothetical protein
MFVNAMAMAVPVGTVGVAATSVAMSLSMVLAAAAYRAAGLPLLAAAVLGGGVVGASVAASLTRYVYSWRLCVLC